MLQNKSRVSWYGISGIQQIGEQDTKLSEIRK